MRKLTAERVIIVVIGVALFALDWAAKSLAERSLMLGAEPIPAPIPLISWYLSYNRGYHYIFGQMGPYQWIAGVSLVLAAGMVVYLLHWAGQIDRTSPVRKIVLAMSALLVGALSNPAEILLRGHATDFFRVKGFPWTANLCDQYVNLIVYVLTPILLFMILKGWDKPREPVPTNPEVPAPPDS
jgi:lipoprotein signal peptidase